MNFIVALFMSGLFAHADSGVRCETGEGFQDCVLGFGGRDIPVKFRIYEGRDKFDFQKPTIVYVPGGPLPISQRLQRTRLFPKDAQVLIVDTVGTSDSRDRFPDFGQLKPGQLSKLFGSDAQARLVRDVVGHLKLSNYIIWGESNGVQISARLVDKLQRDPTIAAKPKAAFFDSGSGRQISKSDDELKSSRCGRKNGPPPQVHPLDPNITAYLNSCYKTDKVKNSELLVGFLERLKPQMQGNGPGFTSASLRNQVGCPPIDKIDYSLWHWSMTCGMFDADTAKSNSTNCSECDVSHCADPKLDSRNYMFGDTAVVGLQSADDCNSWSSTMDFLMENLCRRPGPKCPKATSVYLNEVEIKHGGHVASRSSNFDKCAEGLPRDEIFTQLFARDVKAVKATILRCYDNGRGLDRPDAAK